MKTYPKDKDLKGIYVKRCKCGARPYYDRICTYPVLHWIACGFCKKTGKSDYDKDVAINNWNNDKLDYRC